MNGTSFACSTESERLIIILQNQNMVDPASMAHAYNTKQSIVVVTTGIKTQLRLNFTETTNITEYMPTANICNLTTINTCITLLHS